MMKVDHTRAATSIGHAMQMAEIVARKNSPYWATRDFWKDLTRVYTRRELSDAILKRCADMGINVTALQRKRRRR